MGSHEHRDALQPVTRWQRVRDSATMWLAIAAAATLGATGAYVEERGSAAHLLPQSVQRHVDLAPALGLIERALSPHADRTTAP